MHCSIPSGTTRAQRGIALVIALVLLLVMTMVAVVAMRTTTVDLKMITNTVLGRRAFQNSEGGRMSIGKTLEAHVFFRGWPIAAGGVVPTTAKFPIPIELTVVDGTTKFFCGLSITDVEGRLDQSRFVRVHRSHIVAVDRISSLKKSGDGGVAQLDSSTPYSLPVSRRKLPELKAILGTRA